VNRSNVPQPEKRKENWTLLLVSETGKTIRIKWFKGLAVICMVLLIGAVTAAGTFYYLYEAEARENRWLRSAAKGETPVTTAAAIDALESGKETPPKPVTAPSRKSETLENTARTERKEIPEKGSAEFKKTSGETSSETIAAFEPETAAPSVAQTREKGPSFLVPASESEKEPADQDNRKPLRVAIEDFEYSSGDRKNVYVRYKIKNTDARSRTVSGHAVVVLEGEDRGKPKWLALPKVHLVSGMPTGQEEGQSFSIANYKFMKFRPEGRHDPDQFSKASVYVFDEGGALLLKEVKTLTETPDSDAG
jgi:hypothetical protein